MTPPLKRTGGHFETLVIDTCAVRTVQRGEASQVLLPDIMLIKIMERRGEKRRVQAELESEAHS